MSFLSATTQAQNSLVDEFSNFFSREIKQSRYFPSNLRKIYLLSSSHLHNFFFPLLKVNNFLGKNINKKCIAEARFLWKSKNRDASQVFVQVSNVFWSLPKKKKIKLAIIHSLLFSFISHIDLYIYMRLLNGSDKSSSCSSSKTLKLTDLFEFLGTFVLVSKIINC